MYKVYFGSSSDVYHKKQARSSSVARTLFTSTSEPATSLSTRRGSIAGILSERRASHQSGRHYSDASFILHKRMDEMNSKSGVIFPSMHNKELQCKITKEFMDFANTDEIRLSDKTEAQDENYEEAFGGLINNYNHPDQVIKLRCLKDEETTGVAHNEESFDPLKVPNINLLADSEKNHNKML